MVVHYLARYFLDKEFSAFSPMDHLEDITMIENEYKEYFQNISKVKLQNSIEFNGVEFAQYTPYLKIVTLESEQYNCYLHSEGWIVSE